jgi:hypothetical protein
MGVIMDFYDAWWWLHNHPINISGQYVNTDGVNMGMYDLDIYIARVNPKTNSIDDDEKLNTKTRVWLEFGPYEDCSAPWDEASNWQRTHDPKLDCGGDTFEEAVTKLYHLVKAHYGDYEKNG